jgi:glyoxylase-like metal-dependent hydrolase (beta-lactamase superfamily II)/rhodanese-related sulfurtransferase
MSSTATGLHVITIETPSLGDRSYVVHDGTDALVIDPQRDTDRVLRELDARGLRLSHVLETHIHNDYVTGGFDLAHRTGATYVLNADDEVAFDAHGVRDGDVIRVGGLEVRVMHTPGHTPTHLSYIVTDGTRTSAFTGGSLLYGSVGRSDLISRAMAEELTRRQYASARRLAAELADDVTVLPTHGFGSFCSSAAVDVQTAAVDPRYGVATSTIGQQRLENIALTIGDEQRFVDTILSGLDAYPRYYAHMAPRNRLGPEPIDLSPPVPADASELAARIHAGEWVVDLRARTAYAADHVVGTVNVEVTDSLVTYLAWLVPWGTPVTLIGDTAEEVAEAQRQLTRVGIDRPAAASTGGIDRWGTGLPRGSFRVTDYAGLAAERGPAASEGPFVLDVRRHDERRNRAIAGSVHVPLHELTRRVAEVPSDEDVWVHCAGGYRASIAASLLVRAGRRPVLIDDDEQAITTLGLDHPAA